MPTADDRLSHLGELIKRRRIALRLSYATAAKLGEMNKRTWQRFEEGERTQDVKYAGVEQALRWRTGSILEFLNGGPEPADANLVGVVPGDGVVEEIYEPAGPPEEYYWLAPDARAAVDTIIRQLPSTNPEM